MTNIFLRPNNKLLYRKSKAIKRKDLKEKWFLDIVEEMRKIAGVNQHKDKNKPIMVGLAAPQIGHSLQLIFIDLSATSKRDNKFGDNLFMINPTITTFSKQKERGREGCYSCKPEDFDVRGIVERSKKVKVKFMDLNGEDQEIELIDFTAVIAQHEVDHLNGKVFVHRIKKEKDLHIVFDSEYKLHKKNYKKWKRTISPQLYFKDICKI